MPPPVFLGWQKLNRVTISPHSPKLALSLFPGVVNDIVKTWRTKQWPPRINCTEKN